MATCTMSKTSDRTAVGIGQAVLASEPMRLTTILGSCIGVSLYAPHQRMGMLGHVVLSHSTGPTNYPAKFADTAIPYMVATLKQHGASSTGLLAKIAGGDCMFEDCKSMQIGAANIQAILQALATAGVRVAGQDVGGTLAPHLFRFVYWGSRRGVQRKTTADHLTR